MIPYIQTRLLEWAEWSHMRAEGFYGIGGGQFGYDEPMPSQRGYCTTESSIRCIETEEGVGWLRLENRILGDCVILHYRTHPSWSAQMQADFLRMNVRTFWRRLEASQGLLLGYFLDRACNLFPQTEELRLERRALVLAPS